MSFWKRKPKDPPPFDPARLEAAWARYVNKAASLHAPFREYLIEGATEAQINETEVKIGCALPPDLRYLLTLNNGQSHGYFTLPGWEFFPAERITDEWAVWADLYRSQFKPEGYDCEAQPPIRSDEWWRLKWIPFCGDGGGNHLCADMEPIKGGAEGQIITMWHDAPERELIAPSLTEFIETIADDIESGNLVWNDEWGGIYEPFEDE